MTHQFSTYVEVPVNLIYEDDEGAITITAAALGDIEDDRLEQLKREIAEKLKADKAAGEVNHLRMERE